MGDNSYLLPTEQVQALQNSFIKNHHTLSVAESCTAGLLSYYLTCCPGASGYFLTCVVAYQNELKQKLLGVDKGLLDTQGAVCEAVAVQMAQGVQHQSQSTWALSTTGFAGPTAETATPTNLTQSPHTQMADRTQTARVVETRAQNKNFAKHSAVASRIGKIFIGLAGPPGFKTQAYGLQIDAAQHSRSAFQHHACLEAIKLLADSALGTR